MDHFTPMSAFAGGTLIGFAAVLLLVMNGKIAGISGIVRGLRGYSPSDGPWRIAFVAGLLAGGLILRGVASQVLASTLVRSPAALVMAGLLVGVGTRLGNGCTSGHGVCGIARGSARSLVATVTFMATGMATAYVVEQWFGGRI